MTSPAEPAETPSFRVVVFAAPDDPSDLAEVLSGVLGLHPTDALTQTRFAPGLLTDTLPEKTARHLVDEIGKIGIHSAAVPLAQVPCLDDMEAVHHLRLSAEGLQIVEIHGMTERLVPWPAVDLISVGQVPQETARHFASSEMNTVRSARRTGPSTLETPLSPGPEAWIICADPERFFRVDHKRMNYEYLGERMTDSATTNFRLFLEDFVSYADKAYQTPATRSFLKHGSVSDYSFESTEELQRITQFHLMLHRLAKTGA